MSADGDWLGLTSGRLLLMLLQMLTNLMDRWPTTWDAAADEVVRVAPSVFDCGGKA